MPSSDVGYYYVIDAESGTYFSAENAVLIDSRKLPDNWVEILENGSNPEIINLAEKYGKEITTL